MSNRQKGWTPGVVRRSKHDHGTSVSMQCDQVYLAVCETSLLPTPRNETGVWHFFNRINVPYRFRGNGYSHDLLKAACELWDANGINVICTPNPSGPLDAAALRKLYAKYGFREEPDPDYPLSVAHPLIRRVAANKS